jgi:hypothetical protein
MPPAKKPTASKPRAGDSARARHAENDRVIRRIERSLDVAQTDLGKLRGSLGTGAGDLRRDVAKLLRDARRDVTKMGRATRKDIERLQKDMVSVARSRPNGARASASASGSRSGARASKPAPRARGTRTAKPATARKAAGARS